MRRLFLIVLVAVASWGCGAETEPSGRLEPEPTQAAAGDNAVTGDNAVAGDNAAGGDNAVDEATPPETTATSEAGTYGDAPDSALPLTSLTAILAEPATFRDQVVRTEGHIAQVCQRMGCWMELRDGEDGPAVRVPMAGHSFFLPRTASGRHATLQGRVAMRELTPAARAHLEGEGAQETRSALSIEATGVVID